MSTCGGCGCHPSRATVLSVFSPRFSARARRPASFPFAIGELHGLMANITAALVVAHIFGVAVASVVHKENLVLAMSHEGSLRAPRRECQRRSLLRLPTARHEFSGSHLKPSDSDCGPNPLRPGTSLEWRYFRA